MNQASLPAGSIFRIKLVDSLWHHMANLTKHRHDHLALAARRFVGWQNINLLADRDCFLS
jgi:hypothetical protein